MRQRVGPDGKPSRRTGPGKVIAKRLIDGLNSAGESVAIITAANPKVAGREGAHSAGAAVTARRASCSRAS